MGKRVLCNRKIKTNQYCMGSGCATKLAKKFNIKKVKKKSYFELTLNEALK